MALADDQFGYKQRDAGQQTADDHDNDAASFQQTSATGRPEFGVRMLASAGRAGQVFGPDAGAATVFAGCEISHEDTLVGE